MGREDAVGGGGADEQRHALAGGDCLFRQPDEGCHADAAGDEQQVLGCPADGVASTERAVGEDAIAGPATGQPLAAASDDSEEDGELRAALALAQSKVAHRAGVEGVGGAVGRQVAAAEHQELAGGGAP